MTEEKREEKTREKIEEGGGEVSKRKKRAEA